MKLFYVLLVTTIGAAGAPETVIHGHYHTAMDCARESAMLALKADPAKPKPQMKCEGKAPDSRKPQVR